MHAGHVTMDHQGHTMPTDHTMHHDMSARDAGHGGHTMEMNMWVCKSYFLDSITLFKFVGLVSVFHQCYCFVSTMAL